MFSDPSRKGLRKETKKLWNPYLHQEGHVDDQAPHVPQHEPHHSVRDRRRPNVDIDLQIIIRLVVIHFQCARHDQRLCANRPFHDPRAFRDTRDELEARVSEGVGAVDEAPQEGVLFGGVDAGVVEAHGVLLGGGDLRNGGVMLEHRRGRGKSDKVGQSV